MRYKDAAPHHQAGVFTQLCGMLKRHITLKRRDTRRTVSEILLPLYSLFLLITLKLAVPNPNYHAQSSSPHQFRFLKDLEFLYRNESHIAVVPNTIETQNFTQRMLDFYHTHAGENAANFSAESQFRFFNSSEDLVAAYFKKASSIAYAIVFNQTTGTIRYELRTNPSDRHTPTTSVLYSPENACRHQESQMEMALKESHLNLKLGKTAAEDNLTHPLFKPDADDCPADDYVTSGFLALQYWIDATFLNNQHDHKFEIPYVQLQKFPKGAYTGDWLLGLRLIIPIYIVMSLSQFLTYLILGIVGEKESKLKEGMKIMGLRDPAYCSDREFYWLLGLRLIIPIYIVMSLSQFLTYLILGIVGEKESKLKEGMKIMGLRDPAYWDELLSYDPCEPQYFRSMSLIRWIIILDEPTAGIDPYSRRHMWTILQKKRPGRVILLTTHFMDEADILADRKAVISKGQIRCCGSSLFLKNKFGIGYHLTLVLDTVSHEEAISRLIERHIPSAERTRRHGKELSFILPYNAVDKFAALFLAIEEDIKREESQLGVASYGVSMTTLEESAGIVASFVVSIVSLLYFLQIFLSKSPTFVFWLMSLLSSAGFALAMDKALVLELSGEGVQWSNLFQNDSNVGLSFGQSLIMMFIDIILYGTLAYYLDNVLPSQYGNRKAPLFFLKSSFWSQKKIPPVPKAVSNGTVERNHYPDDIEPVSADLIGREAIVIENLSKEFSGCRKKTTKALENVHLTIYEGQITAILGHNGAGKTTLFNILTGLTLPTSGTAYVYGYDVTDPDGMAMIRRMIGVCPQSNLLYLLLTPKEHLEFYAHLKGIPQSKRDAEISKTLRDVDLDDKADVLTKYLSGGQKRKLSVAIAILGDPKIIILDEPTAGIDPYSRRHMWTILQKKRPGRVILLTTHFMDEADILADRKAVISKGQIRCCGSSLFLKNKFGIGYHLTLVLDTVSHEEAISRLIERHIPSAERTRRHGKELSFILPYNAVDKFAALFLAIEEDIKREESQLGVASYGVSMTTLEEVFLQLEKDEKESDTKTGPIENISKTIVKNRRKRPRRRNKYSTLESEAGDTGTTTETVSQDATSKPGGEDDKIAGIGHESVVIERSELQVFAAITRLRLIRLFRDGQKLYIMLIIPLIFAAIGMYMHRNVNIDFVTKPLNLSQYSYTDSYKVAVHVANSTDAQRFLSYFDNSSITLYNGSYPSLLSYNQTMPLLGAINVYGVNNFTLVYNDTCQHALPILLNLLDNVYDRYLKEADHLKSSSNLQTIFHNLLSSGDLATTTNPQTTTDNLNTTTDSQSTTKNRKMFVNSRTPSTSYRTRPRTLESVSYSTIKAEVQPLPLTSMTQNFSTGLFSMSLFLGMVFVLIPVNMSVELVMDRENKSKNQLRVNGLGAVIYFISHFLILIFLIIVVYLGLLTLIYIFNLSFLKNKISFIVMGFLISLVTPSLILFCTCLSYFFNRSNTARSIMPNIVTVFAFIPFVMVSCSHMYNIGDGLYHRLHSFFCLVDTIYIPYSIIYFMDIIHINCELHNNCPSLTFAEYLSYPELRTIAWSSIAQIPVLFGFLLYLDAKKSGSRHLDIVRQLCGWSRPVTGEEYQRASLKDLSVEEGEEEGGDEDVLMEKNKVKDLVECNAVYNQPVVLLQNLTKVYNKVNMSVELVMDRENKSKNQLRVNGLGAVIYFISHFLILIFLIMVVYLGLLTLIYIFNLSFLKNKISFIVMGFLISLVTPSLILFCTCLSYFFNRSNTARSIMPNIVTVFAFIPFVMPIKHVLWSNITLREHMETYAAIRGVPNSDIPRLVNSFIDGLHIGDHADKEVYECSGGTRRKLSYALAMIGNPRIVLLDEPSTGMDPKSKRFLWDTILASFQGSRGALLTTHSMEEADALCSRVGIMVQGQLRCIGSTQHLKNQYGAGYTLEIKMQVTSYHSEDTTLTHVTTIQNSSAAPESQHRTSAPQNSKAAQIKHLVSKLFQNHANVEEEFVDRIVFSVPQDSVTSLADTFVALEKAKTELNIEEYSFSQTTLEQVYLKFAQTKKEKPVTDV
ncbi:ATP-binding cassette sub-family A member 5-like [Diaphorina citri]|uniref:ATP-binding cassette sub-family A member 5-like n=1 Tax=Diaphorina citri TaxID=121845 RepID=A0A3Q0IVA6_DIACI|nr:ATP-binding cassette sub-family A member 5-like [Diaphorina citri]